MGGRRAAAIIEGAGLDEGQEFGMTSGGKEEGLAVFLINVPASSDMKV